MDYVIGGDVRSQGTKAVLMRRAGESTGERGVADSNAPSTMLMDVYAETWLDTMMNAFGTDEGTPAPLSAAITFLGKLRPSPAEKLGLPTGTLVMLGCGDEYAACLVQALQDPDPQPQICRRPLSVYRSTIDFAFERLSQLAWLKLILLFLRDRRFRNAGNDPTICDIP